MSFNLPFIRNKSELNTIARKDYMGSLLQDMLDEFRSFNMPQFIGSERSLLPRTDVSETDSEYCLEVELPGMDASDIELKIDNNILTIKGNKIEKSENKDKNYYMRERYYGEFQRSITLPSNIQEESITARFGDGILYIRIPKKEQSKSKRIEVQR